MRVIKSAVNINKRDFPAMKTIVLESIDVVQAEALVPDGSAIKVITAQGAVLVFERNTNNAHFDKLREGLGEMLLPFRFGNEPVVPPVEKDENVTNELAAPVPSASPGDSVGVVTEEPALVTTPPITEAPQIIQEVPQPDQTPVEQSQVIETVPPSVSAEPPAPVVESPVAVLPEPEMKPEVMPEVMPVPTEPAPVAVEVAPVPEEPKPAV